MHETWARLQSSVVRKLANSSVSRQLAAKYVWHVFGVHGRDPSMWRLARDMVCDAIDFAEYYYANDATRAKHLHAALENFMLTYV